MGDTAVSVLSTEERVAEEDVLILGLFISDEHQRRCRARRAEDCQSVEVVSEGAAYGTPFKLD